jgi:competence protein ComEA
LPPGLRTVVLAGLGVIGCIVVALVLAFGDGPASSVALEGGAALADPSASATSGFGTGPRVVVVEVVGAVSDPGVYRLQPGARVGELIAAAGGYGPRVDTARVEQDLNLATELVDGDRIRVPSRDDPPAARPPTGAGGGAAGASGTSGSVAGPVDLNQATAEQLDALPGVGPVTVQKILDARAGAPFTTVDELQSRGIVGAKTLDKLRPLVTVG